MMNLLALDVTPIEFNPHTGITGFDNNDLDVSSRDRVECVQNWSEMVTVSSEDLEKSCNSHIISMNHRCGCVKDSGMEIEGSVKFKD